jgi:hypothetical protein
MGHGSSVKWIGAIGEYRIDWGRDTEFILRRMATH